MVDMSLVNKAELARRIGVSKVHLHYVLAGYRKSPSAVKKVADYLGVSIADVRAQIPRPAREANAPPMHQVRPSASKPGRRPPVKNVSKSTR
jgi:transcriptional regulator with XRE-family HTH domain